MSDDNKEVNFDAAFEELTKLTEDKPAQPAAEAAPAPEAPPAPESSTPAQEKPGEETPTQAQESQDAGSGEQAEHEGAGEGAPAGSEGADSGDEGLGEGEGKGAPDPDEDLLNRLGSLLAKAKVPQNKEPEPAPQPAPQQAAQPEEITLSEAEIKAIEDAEKDWPDVVRAVRAESEFKLKRTMDHIFKEVARELRPLMQTVQTLAHRTHLQELQSKVPDYDSVGDKVISWVDKQPAYLQAAYKHVIQQGTAEEVADLITRYKAETGNRALAPTPAPVTKKKAELPTVTKQAAAALAPVSTKRTAPASGGIDPSDFDGAFAAFADKVN
jgi:hypothetical protein